MGTGAQRIPSWCMRCSSDQVFSFTWKCICQGKSSIKWKINNTKYAWKVDTFFFPRSDRGGASMKLLLARCFGILFFRCKTYWGSLTCDMGGHACARVYVCAHVCLHVCAVAPVQLPQSSAAGQPDPLQAPSRPAASSWVGSLGFAFLCFMKHLSCEQPASHRTTPSQTVTFVFCRYRTPWTNFLEEFSIYFQVLQRGYKGKEQLGETSPNTALKQDKIWRILKRGEEKNPPPPMSLLLVFCKESPSPSLDCFLPRAQGRDVYI